VIRIVTILDNYFFMNITTSVFLSSVITHCCCCLLQLNFVGFYRVTLCISGVRLSVCLSVRPSVCLYRSCILSRRLKISSNFFVGPVAYHSSFFYPQRRNSTPRGTPSAGTENRRGEKILRFSTEIAVYRKRYEVGPWLLWNINRKSYALYRIVTFSMTLRYFQH